MAGLEHYQSLARALVAGKKLILAGGVLARGGQRAAAFRELGAERPFLLGSGKGTGPQPTPDEAESFSLEINRPSIMEEIRAAEDALASLPDDAIAALDAYDPDREAIVLGAPFSETAEVAGRRVLGARPPQWAALEDKVVCDDVWDAAGVARAPYEIVEADRGALRAAAARLDTGAGSVWAGDSSEGFNGAADYVRWVRRPDDLDEAEAFFTAHCERVRVMPFLDGIPTSIHGFVHGGRCAVFRPVELLVLRTPTNRFRYAGTATYWDPAPDDREEMRGIAHRVADELVRRVGYRGGFTVDGVMTAEGFRPTELNARFGAGIVGVLAGLAFPLNLVQTIAVEDPDADLRPDDMERMILEHGDANRAGGAYTMTTQVRTATDTHDVVDDGDTFRIAAEDEAASAAILIGPAATGGLVSYQPDPLTIPVGESFAPRVVRAFAFSDEQLGTDLGPLEPAPSLR